MRSRYRPGAAIDLSEMDVGSRLRAVIKFWLLSGCCHRYQALSGDLAERPLHTSNRALVGGVGFYAISTTALMSVELVLPTLKRHATSDCPAAGF